MRAQQRIGLKMKKTKNWNKFSLVDKINVWFWRLYNPVFGRLIGHYASIVRDSAVFNKSSGKNSARNRKNGVGKKKKIHSIYLLSNVTRIVHRFIQTKILHVGCHRLICCCWFYFFSSSVQNLYQKKTSGFCCIFTWLLPMETAAVDARRIFIQLKSQKYVRLHINSIFIYIVYRIN